MIRRGWGEENTDMLAHTVVKVNKNAVGTIIGKLWTSQYRIDGNHKLVELVDAVPTSTTGTLGHTHIKTHLHRVDGGHVLLPFAPKRFDLNDRNLPDMKVYENLLKEGIISKRIYT